jgi:hypothetical protein
MVEFGVSHGAARRYGVQFWLAIEFERMRGGLSRASGVSNIVSNALSITGTLSQMHLEALRCGTRSKAYRSSR